MDAKEKLKNSSGQAIFEMIVFLPFIILLFTLIVTVGNAINGSINQQKATRAYYYYTIRGDSQGMPLNDLRSLNAEGVESVGFYAFGWREKEIGESSLGTCYKMNKFIGPSNNETCFEPDVNESSTNFIRIFTAYGVCTGAWVSGNNGQFYLNPEFTSTLSCTNI